MCGWKMFFTTRLKKTTNQGKDASCKAKVTVNQKRDGVIDLSHFLSLHSP